MRRSGALPLTGVAVLGLFSCAPRPVAVPLDTSAVDASTLVRMVQERSHRVQTLEGAGTVSFDSPEFGGTASFELSLKKPDSLLLVLEGPFGIDIGTLFVSRERYVAFNAQENVVVTGVPKASTLRAIIPFDLTFEEVLQAFSGSFRPPGPGDEVRTFSIDDKRFLVVVGCGSNTCSYWIDNVTAAVTKLEITDGSGALRVEATSSSFVEEDGAAVPRRISIWFPAEKKQIDVLYSSLSINPHSPSFAYVVPPDARPVRR